MLVNKCVCLKTKSLPLSCWGFAFWQNWTTARNQNEATFFQTQIYKCAKTFYGTGSLGLSTEGLSFCRHCGVYVASQKGGENIWYGKLFEFLSQESEKQPLSKQEYCCPPNAFYDRMLSASKIMFVTLFWSTWSVNI